MTVRRMMGIETEYGIVQPGAPMANPMALSAAVVAAYASQSEATARWDYEGEDPLADARGFRLDRAAAHPDQLTDSPADRDAALGGLRRRRPDPAGLGGPVTSLVLTNGARLYVDHAHPEYSSPEVIGPGAAVRWDRAGEEVMRRATAVLAAEPAMPDVALYKNNVDGKGQSYGTHENYLVDRAVPFGEIVRYLTPFLVTRQVFSGAGRVGLGPRSEVPGFQLSQRADYIENDVGLETTFNRPIINTRDEPHADPERHRRLHVIVGDSTMSQTTTLLRVGTTDLVLRMLEAGTIVPDFALANPVQAIRDISRDPTGRVPVPLASGGTTTALGMQSTLLELAKRHAQGAGFADQSPHREVLELWERGLQAIESDQLHLVDTEIEWVMKRRLLAEYADKHGLAPHDERLQHLDLVWHDVHPQRGLVRLLERAGRARTLVGQDRIERAMGTPPQTRARLRGDFVRAAQENRRDFSVDWVHLKLNDAARRTVVLKDPFAAVDARVDQLIEHIRTSGPPGTPRGV